MEDLDVLESQILILGDGEIRDALLGWWRSEPTPLLSGPFELGVEGLVIWVECLLRILG